VKLQPLNYGSAAGLVQGVIMALSARSHPS
jgi:hypothetical protein